MDEDRNKELALPKSKGLGENARSQTSRAQTTRQKVSQEQDVLLHFQSPWPLGRASAAHNTASSPGLTSRKSNSIYLRKSSKTVHQITFLHTEKSVSFDGISEQFSLREK